MRFTLSNLTGGVLITSLATLTPERPSFAVDVESLPADVLAQVAAGRLGVSPNANLAGTGAPGVQLMPTVVGSQAANLDLGTYVRIGPVTGAIVIANPTYSAFVPTPGTRLRYQLTKDATATLHGITYGALFKATTLTAFGATVSQKFLIEFEYTADGHWVQVDVSAGYVA